MLGEQFLAYPPVVLTLYQAVRDGAATYDVYVFQDAARARTVTIEFGDGAKDEATVPAGRAVRKVSFEHRFPRSEARFEQRISLEGASVDTQVITDVCPSGTTKANEGGLAGDAPPMCVG